MYIKKQITEKRERRELLVWKEVNFLIVKIQNYLQYLATDAAGEKHTTNFVYDHFANKPSEESYYLISIQNNCCESLKSDSV